MAQFIPLGDTAFIVRFGNHIDEEVNKKAQALVHLLENEKIPGIIELVPSYTDVVVHYNSLEIAYKKLVAKLEDLVLILNEVELPASKRIIVPIHYGDAFGPDINEVAFQNGLSLNDVVKLHSSRELMVYMLGFTPGFCYMGGMDKTLATPRKRVPADKVLAGSVGIAGNQTGIYPVESPGGWQIIGRTPLRLFDVDREDPFLFKAGDYLKFKSITMEEFNEIEQKIWDGEYQFETL